MRIHTARDSGFRRAVLLMGLLGWLGCAGQRPTDIGVQDARLTPCPSSPNCVSSDAPAGDDHQITPLPLAGTVQDGWKRARAAVASLERVQIVHETEGYLHAECTSALIGYVDDLELHLRADDGQIAVRSASRLGYSDMGVNRGRVEEVRKRIEAAAP
jgi:uncharacterized protein (DUF1499 family)